MNTKPNADLTIYNTTAGLEAELTVEQARAMIERLQTGIKYAEEWHMNARGPVAYTVDMGVGQQKQIMHLTVTPYKAANVK